MKLQDDPRDALMEIAGYLSTVRKDPQRRVLDPEHLPGEKRETAGYWQTTEWLDGLLELSAEAKRVADLPRRIHVLIEDDESDDVYPSIVLSLHASQEGAEKAMSEHEAEAKPGISHSIEEHELKP